MRTIFVSSKNKVRLPVSEPQADIGDMTLTPSSNPNPNQILLLPYATAESPPQNKRMILRGRSTLCGRCIPTLKLSAILEAVSTKKDAAIGPYWTDFSQEISSNLLLPIGIDSVGSAVARYNTWWNKTVENSWFSTSLFTVPPKSSPLIYSQSSMSSVVGCPDSEDTVTLSRKIPLLLTREQKKLLRFWAAGKRRTYNATLQYLQRKTKGPTPYWTRIKAKILKQLPNCYKTVPYQIKGDAVREAWQAVINAKNKGKQTGTFQDLKFQSRRMSTQSLFIPSSAIHDNGIYPRILGDLQYAEEMPAKFYHKREKGAPKPIDEIQDSRLLCEDGSWHLCVTYKEVIDPPPIGAMRVVALDPGVREFLTYFSETGFGWLGHRSINRIHLLCYHLDRLLSRIATCTVRRKKRTLRRAANQIRTRIRCLVKELHCKLVHFLVSNFDVILLPSFDTSQMVVKSKRRIRKKSVRQMLTLSHYKFKQRLLEKAKQCGKHVIIVNEAYTSKTLSWTGEQKQKLGGSKIITAKNGTSMHRDLNGARGILVRFLTWIHALLDEACHV